MTSPFSSRRWLDAILLIGFVIPSGCSRGLPPLPRSGPGPAAPVATASAAAQVANPGVVELDPGSFSRVAAISDVHGQFAAGCRLLQAAAIIDSKDRWCAGRTLLVVVGDSIDKGDDSYDVLVLWQRLEPEAGAAGGRVLVLLGNHEAELLNHLQSGGHHGAKKFSETADSLLKHGMALSELADKNDVLGRFLLGMPLAARVGNTLFCHAGWIPAPDSADPAIAWAHFVKHARTVLQEEHYDDPLLTDPNGILEKRTASFGPDGASDRAPKWWDSSADVKVLLARLQGYGLDSDVFGHQPNAFGLSNNCGPYTNPATGAPDYSLIKLDSGMAPGGHDEGEGQPYAGHMVIFDQPSGLLGAPVPSTTFAGFRIVASKVEVP